MCKPNLANIKKLEKKLKNTNRARAGVISNQTYPAVKGKKAVSVLDVAIWQEFGTTIPIDSNAPEGERKIVIPARSFIRTTFDENYSSYENMVKSFFSKGMPIDEILDKVGQKMQGDIKKKIANIQEPPLAQSTINARKNKTTKPLVVTGTLEGSITYEVYKP